MISLDGSNLEGGGAIVRVALGLSTYRNEVVEIENIRHGREVPGLKAQHLHCIKGLQQLCGAKTNEVEVGTERLKFIPGEFKGRSVSIDIGTAGSITLLLQCLMLPCIFSQKKVILRITGGTDVAWSPQVDYFSNVMLPQLARFAEIDFNLERRGYFPKGNGKVKVRIKPNPGKLNFNVVKRTKLMQIKGVSHAARNLESGNVAERQARSAKLALAKLKVPVNIAVEYSETSSIGSGITLWGICGDESGIDFNNPIILGADSLGERGKRAEIVGVECANKLIQELRGSNAVDLHLADHLIPYIGIVGGKIRVSDLSMHSKTNIWVVEEFLGKRFEIKDGIISAQTL